MTIKRLKELLDNAITEGKGDYKVIVLDEQSEVWQELKPTQIEFYDDVKEVWLGET